MNFRFSAPDYSTKLMSLRRSFSLTEIMVVLILVSIVAGVSVYSLIPFYKAYRFRAEVNTLYDLAQELQLEALSLQSDMKIRFTKEKGKWIAQSESAELLLKPQRIELSHVEQITMNSSTITFYSNGLIEPRQIVSLQHVGEKRGLDLRQPPLMKLWVGSVQKLETIDLPTHESLK